MQNDLQMMADAMRAKMHRFNLQYVFGTYESDNALQHMSGTISIVFIGKDERCWYVSNGAGTLQALGSPYVNEKDMHEYVPFILALMNRPAKNPTEHNFSWRINGKIKFPNAHTCKAGLTNDNDLVYVYKWLNHISKMNKEHCHSDYLSIGPMVVDIPRIQNFWYVHDTPEKILMENDLHYDKHH